jgi:hypothetical protein
MEKKSVKELEPDLKNKLLKLAENLFQQGSFTKALEYFQQVQNSSVVKNADIQAKIETCYNLLLRKYWRQSKLNEFENLIHQMGIRESLNLPLARMKGPQAMQEAASQSTHIHAKLALSSLQGNLKNSLLFLRQQAEFREIAEGWLALLKGDSIKALSSFTEAKLKKPVHAHIGEGIGFLTQQNFIKAQQHLMNLKPFANKFYPALAKTMKWDSSDSTHSHFHPVPLLDYLHSDSIDKLKSAAISLPKGQSSLGGWLWLRIGDHLWSQFKKQEAIKAWMKAKDNNKRLAIDVLKRFLFANLRSKDDLGIDIEQVLQTLYLCLMDKSPKEAREFVEYLVFDENIQAIDPPSIRSNNEWCIPSPTLELQLLWLHLFFSNTVNGLLKACFLKSLPSVLVKTYPWNEWESLFRTLDPAYSDKEIYLKYKFGLCKLFEQKDIARKTAVQLLQINPHLKEEVLPDYVKLALEFAFSNDAAVKAAVSDEVNALQRSFSYDYDLIRLSILTGTTTIGWKQQLMPFSCHLSEPLFAALSLQAAIDARAPASFCCSLIPDERLFNLDQEADARLFYALSHPHLRLAKAKVTQYFNHLAGDTEKKHKLLSRIEATNELVIPYTLIKAWQSKDRRSGYPDYHLGLYYCFNKKFEESLDAFEIAEERLHRDAPEKFRAEATLERNRYAFMQCMPLELMHFFEGLF